MDDQWYYARDGVQQGPMTLLDLRRMADEGRLVPTDYVWNPTMTDWTLARDVPEIFLERSSVPPPPPTAERPSDSDLLARKIAAGVCGVLLGCLGVHKFILGLRGPGLTMLLVTMLTFFAASPVMGIIGAIEGIIYLSKSDEEFYRDYIVNKRGWF